MEARKEEVSVPYADVVDQGTSNAARFADSKEHLRLVPDRYLEELEATAVDVDKLNAETVARNKKRYEDQDSKPVFYSDEEYAEWFDEHYGNDEWD